MVKITVKREDMKFSCAHFTIFSKTERERVHGHNFRVWAELWSSVDSNGMAIDYTIIRKIILNTCKELNEHMLIPEFSPHLKINKESSKIEITFNNQSMMFLNSDVKILQLLNITNEELCKIFIAAILDKVDCVENFKLCSKFAIFISSSPGNNVMVDWIRS